jgi:hypothetical protein
MKPTLAVGEQLFGATKHRAGWTEHYQSNSYRRSQKRRVGVAIHARPWIEYLDSDIGTMLRSRKRRH